jgi:hypothetical protein
MNAFGSDATMQLAPLPAQVSRGNLGWLEWLGESPEGSSTALRKIVAMPFEKSMEDVEVVNSARGEGGDGKHALFEPNAKGVFTTLDLSWPIPYLSPKYQIALR